MFERIARRHADRPDEPGASQTPDGGASTTVTPPEPGEGQAPSTAAEAGKPADAPTERIEPVEPQQGATTDQPATLQPAVAAARRPGFRARGRMRRRLRYLRRLRDLQVRDLGGLIFDLSRFERTRDDLVAQKLDQLRACDDELRALELALDERRDLRDVREPGIGGTCPRCFAVFGSADRFCASCGAALGGAVQGPAQVPLVSPVPPAPPAGPEAQPPAAAPAASPPPAPPEAAGSQQ